MFIAKNNKACWNIVLFNSLKKHYSVEVLIKNINWQICHLVLLVLKHFLKYILLANRTFKNNLHSSFFLVRIIYCSYFYDYVDNNKNIWKIDETMIYY